MIFQHTKTPRFENGARCFADDAGQAVVLPFVPPVRDVPPAFDAATFERALAFYARKLDGEAVAWDHPQIDFEADGLHLHDLGFEFPVGLASRRLPFHLHFTNCRFADTIDARWLDLDSLTLRDCTLQQAFDGAALTARGNVDFGGTTSHCQIDLSSASIQGDLLVNKQAKLFFKRPKGAGYDEQDIRFGAALFCGGIRVHSILLDDLKCRGRIFLDASKLTGILKAANATLWRHENDAIPGATAWDHMVLSAIDANIEGAVILGEESRTELSQPATFQACGQVNLSNSRIGGDLICTAGCFHSAYYRRWRGDEGQDDSKAWTDAVEKFGNKTSYVTKEGSYDPVVLAALNASRTQIEGGVWLDRGFRAHGEVRFNSVAVRGVFRATNDSEINAALPHCRPVFERTSSGWARSEPFPIVSALAMERAQIGNMLLLKDGFSAFGLVSLRNAIINGDVDCTGGTFHACWPTKADRAHQQPQAFVLSGAMVAGSVFLVGARIAPGTDLPICDDRLEDPNTPDKEQDFFLSYGQVRFRGTQIGRNLHLGGGRFKLMPPRMDDAHSSDPDIDGQLPLIGWFHSAQVAGTTFLSEIDRAPVCFHGSVSFADMHTDGWEDAIGAWPQCRDDADPNRRATFELNGLTYNSLRGPTDGRNRLMWLLHQPEKDLWPPKRKIAIFHGNRNGREQETVGFKTQPWEQCATVLHSLGYRTDARFLYQMEQRFIRLRGRLNPLARIMNFGLGTLVGHGYRVLFAILWAIWLVGIGTIVADAGFNDHHIVPAPAEYAEHHETNWVDVHAPDYPTFNPLLFSLDMALPAGNVRQRDYWIAIDDNKTYLVPDAFAPMPLVRRVNECFGRMIHGKTCHATRNEPQEPVDAKDKAVAQTVCVLEAGLILLSLGFWRLGSMFAFWQYRNILNRNRVSLLSVLPVAALIAAFFMAWSVYLIDCRLVFCLLNSGDTWLLLHVHMSVTHVWFVFETLAGWVLLTMVAVALGSTIFHYRHEKL